MVTAEILIRAKYLHLDQEVKSSSTAYQHIVHSLARLPAAQLTV